MNRRSFLTRTLAFLPLPAFALAASLWLPKEKPFFVPEMEMRYTFFWHEIPDGWGEEGIAFMHEGHVWLHRKILRQIELHEDFPRMTEGYRP